MSDRIRSRMAGISDTARHEAAVWIARLHAPDRPPEVEEGLRRWLGEREEYRRAFELANELWEASGHIPDDALPRIMRWPAIGASRASIGWRSWVSPAAGLAALLAVAILGWYALRDPVIRTGVGEQRTITLEDGTRVSLNTATRISLGYGNTARRVKLHAGEVLFEVAKDNRPFVVEAGGREVRALGTAFLVRSEAKNTVVTLMEGRVTVAPIDSAGGIARKGNNAGSGAIPDTGNALSAPDAAVEARQPSSVQQSHPPVDTDAVITLLPGQRLAFSAGSAGTALDWPRLEPLVAWQRGIVALDYTSLAGAVAEMNRYSEIEMVIEDPQAADAKVSGVFRAGDSLSFAQAISRTHNLRVSEEEGRIVLRARKE